ncbi:hypothetical protein QAD02_017924 [Eretmocerus hayati]|uniref:Uncharacterized protein n=1 Tax=Eretmocerus hayati TaxID=131215 RepID=A0ACC2PFL6_9HYME|nr:hypothetical protein QAD02_017924 [Eretmocerus hayati]
MESGVIGSRTIGKDVSESSVSSGRKNRNAGSEEYCRATSVEIDRYLFFARVKRYCNHYGLSYGRCHIGAVEKGTENDYCPMISSQFILCSHPPRERYPDYWNQQAELVVDRIPYSETERESPEEYPKITLYEGDGVKTSSRTKPLEVIPWSPEPGTEATLMGILFRKDDVFEQNGLVHSENVTLITLPNCSDIFGIPRSECDSYLWIEDPEGTGEDIRFKFETA